MGCGRCDPGASPGPPGRDERRNSTRGRPCCGRLVPCREVPHLLGIGVGWWWNTGSPGWPSWASGEPGTSVGPGRNSGCTWAATATKGGIPMKIGAIPSDGSAPVPGTRQLHHHFGRRMALPTSGPHPARTGVAAQDPLLSRGVTSEFLRGLNCELFAGRYSYWEDASLLPAARSRPPIIDGSRPNPYHPDSSRMYHVNVTPRR